MSSTALELGEIVTVEVREASGAVSGFSHEYPVDPSGLLRIPSLAPVTAAGLALTPDLRDALTDRFIADAVLSSPTVNVTLSGVRLDYATVLQPGETLFLRILAGDGTLDPSSGGYPIDGSGTVTIPFLGGVLVRGSQPFEAEHQIEQGLVDGGFFAQPFVNVSRLPLA